MKRKEKDKKTVFVYAIIGGLITLLLYLADEFKFIRLFYDFNQSLYWYVIHHFNLSEFGLLLVLIIPLIYTLVGAIIGVIIGSILIKIKK